MVISGRLEDVHAKATSNPVLELYSRTLCLEAAAGKNGDLIGQQVGFV